jgi:hypothetical protein
MYIGEFFVEYKSYWYKHALLQFHVSLNVYLEISIAEESNLAS